MREERELAQRDEEERDYNSSSLIGGRAISCSDLLFDFSRTNEKQKVHLEYIVKVQRFADRQLRDLKLSIMT